jgi:hypothetical protein
MIRENEHRGLSGILLLLFYEQDRRLNVKNNGVEAKIFHFLDAGFFRLELESFTDLPNL